MVFGLAALAGSAVGPLRGTAAPHDHGSTAGEHTHDHAAALPAAPEPASAGGLSIAAGGFTLVPDTTIVRAGRVVDFGFRVIGPDGRPARNAAARADLTVIRRDLSGIQLLEARDSGAGHWTTPLLLPGAGVHRAIAEVTIGGRPVALGIDLIARGGATPSAADPAPSADDYRVELSASGTTAGTHAGFLYRVSRRGVPLDLRADADAHAHLAVLRDDDLAFLHVHTHQTATPGLARFGATFPTAGRYHLFLRLTRDRRSVIVTRSVVVSP